MFGMHKREAIGGQRVARLGTSCLEYLLNYLNCIRPLPCAAKNCSQSHRRNCQKQSTPFEECHSIRSALLNRIHLFVCPTGIWLRTVFGFELGCVIFDIYSTHGTSHIWSRFYSCLFAGGANIPVRQQSQGGSCWDAFWIAVQGRQVGGRRRKDPPQDHQVPLPLQG